MSGDLIRLRNRSKLVKRSLFAIIDLLQGANLFFYSLYGVWGDNFFIKKFQILEKKTSFFITFNLLLIFMLLLLYKP